MTDVVDTHALVWFLEKNPRLSTPAHHALSDPSAKIVIPTIVLAEINFLHARARIATSLAVTLGQLAPLPNCVIYALDKAVAQRLPTTLNIHDAIIVATALVFRDLLGRGYLRPENWLYPVGGGSGGSVQGMSVLSQGNAGALYTFTFTPGISGASRNSRNTKSGLAMKACRRL